MRGCNVYLRLESCIYVGLGVGKCFVKFHEDLGKLWSFFIQIAKGRRRCHIQGRIDSRDRCIDLEKGQIDLVPSRIDPMVEDYDRFV